MGWAEKVDQFGLEDRDGHTYKQVVKCVGPIWGEYEAEKKINAFMAENGICDGWVWTGKWGSENGTSYARFEKRLPSWGETADDVRIVEQNGDKWKKVTKCVGPIYGQHEAENKINTQMDQNGFIDWHWTGKWHSENGTSYAKFEKKVKGWAQLCDGIQTVTKDNGQKVEHLIKCVGPIYNQNEAREKVNRFLTGHSMMGGSMCGWTWTGRWGSQDGTSYAKFERNL